MNVKETVAILRREGLTSDEILEKLVEISEEDTEAKIRRFLNIFCVPVHISGYKYWVEIIQLHKQNQQLSITQLYYKLAWRYGKTWRQVERTMRFAVECAFNRCSEDITGPAFKGNLSEKTGRPSNQQFLAALSELI